MKDLNIDKRTFGYGKREKKTLIFKSTHEWLSTKHDIFIHKCIGLNIIN